VSSSPTEGRNGATAAAGPSLTSGATVEVTMPQMGVSMAEGTLAVWHKRVGDWVNAEETICEISTDKIDSDVPAPAAGRVVEIAVEVDETVPVGTVLARIATDALAGEAHPDEELDGPQATPADAQASSTREPAVPAAPAREQGARRHYSPVVQRIAAAENVDLSEVQGTGRGGRVSRQDVLAFIARRGTEAAEPATRELPQQPPGEPPLHTESPYREPSSGPRDGDTPERLSRMRRSIAEHMVRSLQTAATCTSVIEADFSGIESARAALGLTHLPFVARSVIDALRVHPELNATLEGETITRHSAVGLGIAISLGADGLIVPVIDDAQELAPEGLARRISDLAQRARAGELKPDEVRGGTFTITNPGGYGTLVSTPIINQPQVAILDLEAVVKRPVVVTDADGRDSIAIRPMAFLCLSWDHRALDGALAAQFLATVRKRIESWSAA
jgi:pyruvate/2-oxoglutarate dehydrogenase complex dihydrolipoamide acyltransferase (E2) component